MADIYGSQSDVLLQTELADAEDEDDFEVKLDSLKIVWEKNSPWFSGLVSKKKSTAIRVPHHVCKKTS